GHVLSSRKFFYKNKLQEKCPIVITLLLKDRFKFKKSTRVDNVSFDFQLENAHNLKNTFSANVSTNLYKEYYDRRINLQKEDFYLVCGQEELSLLLVKKWEVSDAYSKLIGPMFQPIESNHHHDDDINISDFNIQDYFYIKCGPSAFQLQLDEFLNASVRLYRERIIDGTRVPQRSSLNRFRQLVDASSNFLSSCIVKKLQVDQLIVREQSKDESNVQYEKYVTKELLQLKESLLSKTNNTWVDGLITKWQDQEDKEEKSDITKTKIFNLKELNKLISTINKTYLLRIIEQDVKMYWQEPGFVYVKNICRDLSFIEDIRQREDRVEKHGLVYRALLHELLVRMRKKYIKVLKPYYENNKLRSQLRDLLLS
ncbi:hypothetical protein AKO1_000108, partial [Acrasis kona]